MRPAVVVFVALIARADAGCADWCSEWTCENEYCTTCVQGCDRPWPPPPPPPKPPRPPPPPDAPLSSVGRRKADFWTRHSQLYTNAFGDPDVPLRIKGASWFGLESSPCYPGGADKAKVKLGFEFLRQHGFNALRLPLAVDAVLSASRGDQPACIAPDTGVFYTYNFDWIDYTYLQYIEQMILEAGKHGILVMLDLHAMVAGVWPDTGDVGVEGRSQLDEAWAALAALFCDADVYWNVFAADLKNEPHGMFWGPLGSAPDVVEHVAEYAPPPPPAHTCVDDPNFLDTDGDGCVAYELTADVLCGMPGYEASCSHCCATCGRTHQCASHLASSCEDDTTFREETGQGCDIYQQPIHYEFTCGAPGYEHLCSTCCASCTGAPMCQNVAQDVSPPIVEPPPQTSPVDTVYPWHERWDTLAKQLGDRVHVECPRWLIVVEGVGHCMGESDQDCSHPSAAGQDMGTPTWWGENLQAVDEYPVRLEYPNKVVYSPHSYGPSVYAQPYFQDQDFPSNMPRIWDLQWGHLSKRGNAAILLGEWGGRFSEANGDRAWQQKMAAYLKDEGNQVAGSFYWCLNPDSGDTGGLLESWVGHRPDTAKLSLLSAMPGTPVPTTEGRARPPPPTSPAPPPMPSPSPSPPPPPPPLNLPHLAVAHPPPPYSSPIKHRRRRSPPPAASSGTEQHLTSDSESADSTAGLEPATAAKLAFVLLFLTILIAMSCRCWSSLTSKQQLLSDEGGRTATDPALRKSKPKASNGRSGAQQSREARGAKTKYTEHTEEDEEEETHVL